MIKASKNNSKKTKGFVKKLKKYFIFLVIFIIVSFVVVFFVTNINFRNYLELFYIVNNKEMKQSNIESEKKITDSQEQSAQNVLSTANDNLDFDKANESDSDKEKQVIENLNQVIGNEIKKADTSKAQRDNNVNKRISKIKNQSVNNITTEDFDLLLQSSILSLMYTIRKTIAEGDNVSFSLVLLSKMLNKSDLKDWQKHMLDLIKYDKYKRIDNYFLFKQLDEIIAYVTKQKKYSDTIRNKDFWLDTFSKFVSVDKKKQFDKISCQDISCAKFALLANDFDNLTKILDNFSKYPVVNEFLLMIKSRMEALQKIDLLIKQLVNN